MALVGNLFEASIVHGDLSEYNLLYWTKRLFVIDFPQAIDFSSPMDRPMRVEKAKPLLLRDLRNLQNYFEKYGVELHAENHYRRLMSRFES